MKCKKCRKDFVSIFSDVCPFCGTNNSVSLGDIFDSIFQPNTNSDNKKPISKEYDPYDWENPDNCSDREYEDDDDYDDFDN